MRRLLVIDDHEDIRENTAEILSLAGYETFTAENGKRGVEVAIREKPDLVICDIMMPELDGYGVLHLLRKNPVTENVPFIFLTAKTERVDFRKGMEMGADDYITKPFDDIELLNAIEIRLHKYDVLRASYPSGEKGVSDLLNDLNSPGLLHMDLNKFEGEQLEKKFTLYTEGRRPKFLYYLQKGKIKAYRINEDGKEYITNFYAAGDYIGYLPILEESNYEDTAIVLEDAEVVMVPREDFVNAIYNDISITTKFVRLIAQNVQEKEERLLSLAYSTLRKRVAKALVDIHSKFNSGDSVAPGRPLDISREDIAQYIGTATESLIRTLSDFKAEKLIEIKEGKIRIADVNRLSNLLY